VNRDPWGGGAPRFGLAFQGNKTPAEYRGLAEIVDRYPFDVVSVYNDLLFQPALGPLLWMAPLLSHAQLGPAALNPYTLHPVEIAGQVALLDHASGGRAYLGLARGAWLDRICVAQPRPVQTLRETVLLVRHLLARRTEAFTGGVWRHAAEATLRYAPLRASVPVTIGTWGRTTARMAGEVADEVKIGGSANPAIISRLRPEVRRGSKRAGRNEDAVGICLGAVTVVDVDRERARALARREVALYLTVVAELDPETDPEWLERIRAAAARNDTESIARNLSDEVLDRFAFSGSPRDLVRQVESIASAGATRIEFGTPLGLNAADAIRLLGERVLVAFHQEQLDVGR
jgi:5,10-methylenetetrahydromethanopterin reductase